MQEQFQQIKQASVLVNQVVHNEYTLYLNDPIETIDQYIDHIQVFKSATEQDVILLEISSRGGDVSVSENYIAEMEKCQALIIAIVGMGTASAASAIALAADDVIVGKMGTMLVHSFSSGSQGTAGEMYNEADFNRKLNDKWLEARFGGFLTEEEKADIRKGVDLMFDADEIEDRWSDIMESRHASVDEGNTAETPSVQPTKH